MSSMPSMPSMPSGETTGLAGGWVFSSKISSARLQESRDRPVCGHTSGVGVQADALRSVPVGRSGAMSEEATGRGRASACAAGEHGQGLGALRD